MRGRSLAATLPAWVAVIRRRLDARPESRPRAASPGGSTSSGACCCWWPRSRCTCCCRRLPRVFGSWRSLSHLDWPFAVLVLACEAASYMCLWELDRIALGTSARFPIACAQLAGNAVGRFVPGAPTPFAVEMLRRAGVDAGQAAAALTALTG